MIIVKANMIVAMIIVILIYPNLSFLLLFIRMFGVGVLFWLLLCSSSSSSSSSCCVVVVAVGPADADADGGYMFL